MVQIVVYIWLIRHSCQRFLNQLLFQLATALLLDRLSFQRLKSIEHHSYYVCHTVDLLLLLIYFLF